MVRTIIQLTEDQARRLRERAKQRGISVSALIRESVDASLAKPADMAEIRRRAAEAVGYADLGASNVAENHDAYLEDAYQQ